jgi:hypothetical protein
MKGVYSRRIQGRFKDLLEELAARGDERASLAGEVDVARGIAEQAANLLGKAIATEGVSITSIAAAATFAQTALTHVSDLVTKMIKVQTLDKSTLDAEQVDAILAQVSQIIGDQVEDEQLRAKILRDFDKIKVPEKAANFTVNIS